MLKFVNYYTLSLCFLAWYNGDMGTMKIAADYAAKHHDRSDFMHSSGYAQVQNPDTFGAAGAASFEARKAMEESRKYMRGYKASKIGAVRYSGAVAKEYRKEDDNFRKTTDRFQSEEDKFRVKRAAREQGAQGAGATQTQAGPAGKPQVVLGNARAPQVPTRRGGI